VTTAIEVRSVSKSFDGPPVLDDVSVAIESGSLTALLGPSGGGKSTLLRVIAGLETPDSGTVHIAGIDATRLAPQRRNVGFVFQHYAAFKHMTVYGNVAFGLEVRKRPKAETRRRVTELLELVHLEQLAGRYPAQLSGGQRQRMALARALAVQPEVLLLDEPFGALDAQVRKELRTWLRRLHDEVHVTTVFVTHDQEEAMDVADHIAVLAGGRVVQVGAPHDIYDNPSNAFVMGFLGSVTRLDGRLVRPHDIEVGPASAAGTPATVTRVARLGFEVRLEMTTCGGEIWAQLTRSEADALGVEVGDTVTVRPRADARTLAA
jgi:sulfate/thiosulfate transport system ATP-binding protein